MPKLDRAGAAAIAAYPFVVGCVPRRWGHNQHVLVAAGPPLAEVPLTELFFRCFSRVAGSEFDRRVITQTSRCSGGFVPPGPWDCAMLQYAQFVGEWDDYRNKYRWHKLRGGAHTAVGDCQATLARIKEIAGAKRRKYFYEVLMQADEVVEGREAPPPVPSPTREPPREPRSMPAFGISMSLDGSGEYFGPEYKLPTVPEQDAELSEGYREKLRAYEQANFCTVATMTDIVRFTVTCPP